MAAYMVHWSGHQFGPHSTEEIQSMLEAGQIDETALIWCNGWPKWLPVSTIAKPRQAEPELEPQLAPAPARRMPPQYQDIITGSAWISLIATAYLVYAGISIGIAIMWPLHMLYADPGAWRDSAFWVTVASCLLLALFFMAIAALIRWLRGIGLAIRDIARNSYR